MWHIAVGAILVTLILLIEVMLAGVIKLIGMIPFAPDWFKDVSEFIDQAMLMIDVPVAGLFLLAEIAKLAIGLWKEIRDAL